MEDLPVAAVAVEQHAVGGEAGQELLGVLEDEGALAVVADELVQADRVWGRYADEVAARRPRGPSGTRGTARRQAGADAGVVLGEGLGQRRPVIRGGEPLLEGLAGRGDEPGAVGERLEAVPGHPGVGGLGVGGVRRRREARGVQGEDSLEGREVAPTWASSEAPSPSTPTAGPAAERRLGLQEAVEEVVLPGVADERLGGQLGLVGEQGEEATVTPPIRAGTRWRALASRIEGDADLVGEDASEDAEHPGAEEVGADQGGAARAESDGREGAVIEAFPGCRAAVPGRLQPYAVR